MEVFGLYLVFPNPGLHKFEHPIEPFRGDVTGLLQEVNLFLFFYASNLFEKGKAFGHIVGRVLPLGLGNKAVFAGLGFHRLAVVFIGIEVDGFGLAHQIKKDALKVL